MENITLPKEKLFALLNSHSVLNQQEYDKTGSIYTQNHFAYKAEMDVLKCLDESIMNELHNYTETHVLNLATGLDYTDKGN